MTTISAEVKAIWRPLLLCPHRELAGRLRGVFAELGLGTGVVVAEYPRMGAVAALVGQSDCNVCFLDVASNSEHAMQLLSEAAAVMPVVAVNARKDADLILRCLHRGAVEFLAEPSAVQVRAALEHLQRLTGPASTQKASSVYCVVPGKPGAGASTLALHLALELKRAGKSRVLLVDTDVRGGAIAFFLKLRCDFHLGDAVRDRLKLDADLWGRLAIRYCGIDLLPAPDNPASLIDIDRSAAAALIEFWRKEYDAVVLDTAGAVPMAVEFARLADQVVVVTTNDLMTLHATRRSIEYLEQNAVERTKLRLVLNRFAPSAGLTCEEVQTALKMEPCALLGNEYEVAQQAVLEGRPIAQGTRFEKSLRTLAARLSGQSQPAPKKSGWLGRLPVKFGAAVSREKEGKSA